MVDALRSRVDGDTYSRPRPAHTAAGVTWRPGPKRRTAVGVPLRVLIVDDSEDDALLLVRELSRGGYRPQHARVASAEAMAAALDRQSWDLVIGDHSMPQFSGPAALALVRGRG